MAPTILVADDDDALRTLLRITLSDRDADLLFAADGEEALRLAREHPPRLALLDVRMPLVDGVEVCRRIKHDPRTADCVVIMLTSVIDDEVQHTALAAGAAAYVTKPFSPLRLMEQITTLLGVPTSDRAGIAPAHGPCTQSSR